jgi:hypothetical protein
MINNAILGVIAGGRIAAPAGPGVTWDPTNLGLATLSNGDLTATATGAQADKFGNVLSTIAFSSGKYYCEVVMNTVATFTPSVGFSQYRALGPLSDTEIGESTGQVALRSNGSRYANGSVTTSFTTGLTSGAVVMLAVDVATRRVWIGTNGTWRGSGSPDPAAGTSWAATLGGSGDIYVGASSGRQSFAGVVTARFKASEFSYSIPSGFSAVDPNP